MKSENQIELLLSRVGLDSSNKLKPLVRERRYYVCLVCKLKFKTNRGAWRHIEQKHFAGYGSGTRNYLDGGFYK